MTTRNRDAIVYDFWEISNVGQNVVPRKINQNLKLNSKTPKISKS